MTHKLLRALNVSAKPKPAEPDGLDGHMAQAIKAAVLPEVAAQVAEQLRDLPAMVAEQVKQTATEQISLQARRHAANAFDDLRREQPQQPPGASSLDTRVQGHPAPQAAADSPMRPQVPQAPRPMPIITMSRGADGRIRSASVGAMTFTVERDSAGKAQRLIPQE